MVKKTNGGQNNEQERDISTLILAVVVSLVVVFGGLFLVLRFLGSTSRQEMVDYQSNFSSENWLYDKNNNVYYQIGLVYADKVVDSSYESMGIYVPGEYFSCEQNGEKYRCKVKEGGEKGAFTAEDAPMVMPVDTPGYSAQKAPTGYNYNTVAEYIEAGMIYLYPGCRGIYKSDGRGPQGVPWGVTDLKAAVRYVRYNKEMIPGDSEAIYTFGHSGGGAQSAILGASGDNELYAAYLDNIGAKMKNRDGEEISDAIRGVMTWNPITSLDIADEAYEWNMGRFSRDEGWEGELSKLLAENFRVYINRLGLKTDNKPLVLETLDEGTYYDYFMKEMSIALTNYLHDNFQSTDKMKEYVSGFDWADFDEESGVARVTDLEGFVQAEKPANKAITAFDGLERKQTENRIFGTQKSTEMHFDMSLYETLKANADKLAKYPEYKDYTREFERDFSENDMLGKSVTLREKMYNPIFYLTNIYEVKCICDENKNEATVAKNWRIRTGLSQGDTASTTEINLKLALENYGGLKVNFATVWGGGHTEVERSGNADENFIAWIKENEK